VVLLSSQILHYHTVMTETTMTTMVVPHYEKLSQVSLAPGIQ
jgi:hypothetical protein